MFFFPGGCRKCTFVWLELCREGPGPLHVPIANVSSPSAHTQFQEALKALAVSLFLTLRCWSCECVTARFEPVLFTRHSREMI